jgi:hypothetical protein
MFNGSWCRWCGQAFSCAHITLLLLLLLLLLSHLFYSYGARVDTGFALKSLQDGLMGIYRTEGMAGLWKGSGPSILKVDIDRRNGRREGCDRGREGQGTSGLH